MDVHARSAACKGGGEADEITLPMEKAGEILLEKVRFGRRDTLRFASASCAPELFVGPDQVGDKTQDNHEAAATD